MMYTFLSKLSVIYKKLVDKPSEKYLYSIKIAL